MGISKQNVDPAASDSGADCGVLTVAAGNPYASRDPTQCVGVDADHPVIKITVHQVPGSVEVSLTDVADSACYKQLVLVGKVSRVTARTQEWGGRKTSDAHECHGQPGPLPGNRLHGGVVQQAVPNCLAAHQAGGGHEGRGRAHKPGELSEQPIALGLDCGGS